jgi:hypothetical protein
MAGYSGTPLLQKLGIKPGVEVHLVDPPKGYLASLGPLPEGARVVSRQSAGTDLVHVFASRKADLARALRACRKKLKPTGMIWVSWPKKSAKVATDVTEHTIRELAFPLGLVDVKVCAVDEVWSGLKLVVRKELR